MIREFIRFNAFLKPALKLPGEKGIEQLQKKLSDNPEAGALIRGGGGLRNTGSPCRAAARAAEPGSFITTT